MDRRRVKQELMQASKEIEVALSRVTWMLEIFMQAGKDDYVTFLDGLAQILYFAMNELKDFVDRFI